MTDIALALPTPEMPRTTAQLGFPRRVVGIYLLSSLAALVLLGGGMLLSVQDFFKAEATEAALSRVDRVASAVKIDLASTKGEKAQSLTERARLEGRLAWCAVTDAMGRFVAHTDRRLMGSATTEPIGTQLRWGVIGGVRYRTESGQLINEYRVPLEVDRKPLGTLVVAVVEPTWQGTVRKLGAYLPVAIAGPLGLILAGGWWLWRTAKPLAEISQDLSTIARLPIDQEPSGNRVAAKSLAAIGWNRVVEALQDRRDAVASDVAPQVNDFSGVSGKTRVALESLSEGIAVTDAEGRIEFANRAITALLCRETALDGEQFSELLAAVSPDSAATFDSESAQAEVISELKLATPAGDRTLRLARAPLASEALPGHVWTVRDVTQQKLMEASRDQFIDTATHELRTPLSNIKAYAETLAMGDMIDIEEQKEFCNTINTEATRLARFVDDLLSISSLEVGSIGVQRTNVDVRRLLEEAAEKVRPLLKQRSMTFDVSLSEKLGEARLDKDKVSGMVVNLLGNAAKYTPDGGAVALAAVRQDEHIKIEVRDNGPGIAEEESERIFEKFFRSANPAVRDKVGTGLGLPLAREIARLHRGDITLASTLGEGSTFTVILPVQ